MAYQLSSPATTAHGFRDELIAALDARISEKGTRSKSVVKGKRQLEWEVAVLCDLRHFYAGLLVEGYPYGPTIDANPHQPPALPQPVVDPAPPPVAAQEPPPPLAPPVAAPVDPAPSSPFAQPFGVTQVQPAPGVASSPFPVNPRF